MSKLVTYLGVYPVWLRSSTDDQPAEWPIFSSSYLNNYKRGNINTVLKTVERGAGQNSQED
jgi:hypothetical protein